MSTLELKKKLIGKITDSDDENLLREVYRLLELETENIALYPLTDEQISVVQRIATADKGRKIPK
jgi:CRISPR/Cas system-associated endoribonuclease Cas2